MSDCGVCVGFGGDYAEEFNREYKVADTLKKCSECNDEIPAGAKYEHVNLVQDGDEQEYVTCLVCDEIREAFSCDGVMYGGMFWEDMADYVFEEINEACYLRLKTTAAKQRLQEYWIDWKFSQCG